MTQEPDLLDWLATRRDLSLECEKLEDGEWLGWVVARLVIAPDGGTFSYVVADGSTPKEALTKAHDFLEGTDA